MESTILVQQTQLNLVKKPTKKTPSHTCMQTTADKQRILYSTCSQTRLFDVWEPGEDPHSRAL